MVICECVGARDLILAPTPAAAAAAAAAAATAAAATAAATAVTATKGDVEMVAALEEVGFIHPVQWHRHEDSNHSEIKGPQESLSIYIRET
jgi:hypothetical protein